MKNQWQLQHAKSHLSEVVDRVANRGPQTITRHGKEVAVMISPEEYRKFKHRKQSLVEFFRSSPLVGLEIPARSREPYRTRLKLG